MDPGVAEYVASVGQRVAAVSDRDLPYEFVVVNDGTPNAWALPGGKIGIHRGILVELENEAELAAILGHEVVHAAAKHGAHGFQRQLLFGLALATDDSKHARQIVGATNIGFHLAGQKFGRDQERMSDYHGMKYMHWAGYDTSAAVTLQEKFVALSKGRDSGWLEGLFASHPPSPRTGGEQPRRPRGVPTGRGGGRSALPGAHGGPARRPGSLRPRRPGPEEHRPGLRSRVAVDRPGDRGRSHANRSSMAFGAIFSRARVDTMTPYGRTTPRSSGIRTTSGITWVAVCRGIRWGMSAWPGPTWCAATACCQRRSRATNSAAMRWPMVKRVEAKRLFEAASGASGEVGTAALNAYVSLDVEDEPWKYVKAESLFEDGQVVVEVSNTSGYDLSGIVVRVNVEINGKSVYRRLDVGRLDSGYYDVLESGIYYRAEDEVEAGTRILEAAPGW